MSHALHVLRPIFLPRSMQQPARHVQLAHLRQSLALLNANHVRQGLLLQTRVLSAPFAALVNFKIIQARRHVRCADWERFPRGKGQLFAIFAIWVHTRTSLEQAPV